MATSLITSYQPTVNNILVIDSADGNCNINATNGNHFVWSQFTGLFIHNSDDAALTATITSNADAAGKTKTVTASIPPGDYAVVNLLDSDFATGGLVSVAWAGTTPAGFAFPITFIKP